MLPVSLQSCYQSSNMFEVLDSLVVNILTVFCPSQFRSGDEKAKTIGTGFLPSFCLMFLFPARQMDRCVNVNANHSDNCCKERVACDGRLVICTKRASVPMYIEGG